MLSRFVFIFLFAIASFSLSAADLNRRFEQAAIIVRNVQVPIYAPTIVDGQVPQALQRLQEVSAAFRRLSDAIFEGNNNPTDANQRRVCALTRDILDLLNGVEWLDGYNQVADEFQTYRQSVEEVQSTMECRASSGVRETCLAQSRKWDGNQSCRTWAERGECSINPDYMWVQCCSSCARTEEEPGDFGSPSPFTCSWGSYLETYYFEAPGSYRTEIQIFGRLQATGYVQFISPTEASFSSSLTGPLGSGTMSFSGGNYSAFDYRLQGVGFVSSRWTCTGSFISGF